MVIRRAVFFCSDTPPSSGTPGESAPGGAPNPGGSGTGAKPPAEGGTSGADDAEPDFASLDPRTQNYIKKLRRENADARKDFNALKGQFDGFQEKLKSFAGGNGDDEQLTPEQQVDFLQGHVESIAVQNAILTQALHHGIGVDGLEYFQFKVTKACEELEEGEELSDEALAEIVADVRGKTGASKSGATSPAGHAGGNPPPKPADDGITVEKFAASLTLQSQIYNKDPERYARLRDEAKAKGLYNKR